MNKTRGHHLYREAESAQDTRRPDYVSDLRSTGTSKVPGVQLHGQFVSIADEDQFNVRIAVMSKLIEELDVRLCVHGVFLAFTRVYLSLIMRLHHTGFGCPEEVWQNIKESARTFSSCVLLLRPVPLCASSLLVQPGGSEEKW